MKAFFNRDLRDSGRCFTVLDRAMRAPRATHATSAIIAASVVRAAAQVVLSSEQSNEDRPDFELLREQSGQIRSKRQAADRVWRCRRPDCDCSWRGVLVICD